MSKTKYTVQTDTLPNHIGLEDKGNVLVLKNKIKIKKEGKGRVLPPKALFDGLQELYNYLLDTEGNPIHGKSPEATDSELDEAALFATVWSGT